MDDFKVGDTVKVIDRGEIYETHAEAFKVIGFKNKYKNKCHEEHKNMVFRIFDIRKHLNKNLTLISIRSGSVELLIDPKGLIRYEVKKIKRKKIIIN